MRIISGSLRGRDLGAVPKGVRPTSDRVRESLFSALGSVEGAHVLDLFAGTGALGLEAYSRGAARVVYVERSRSVARALTQRLERLSLAEEPSIQMHVVDAMKGIARLAAMDGEAFDLAFLDPPYADEDREALVETLFESGVLSPDARVVVEGPTRHPLRPLPGVRIVDERKYGDTQLTWLVSARPEQE
ncbi:MAG: 16S rRNA (guanine(966)-N(2))-methyltransferase RsmD [Myxococcota bacterium]